ncbi:hypothetical protein J1614_007200 [Plenodomus biglobosus]|nr:hypothetical protein J1614_007200 [Plenodomus biglobosus]
MHLPACIFIKPTSPQQELLRKAGFLGPAQPDGELQWTAMALALSQRERPLLDSAFCAGTEYIYNCFHEYGANADRLHKARDAVPGRGPRSFRANSSAHPMAQQAYAPQPAASQPPTYAAPANAASPYAQGYQPTVAPPPQQWAQPPTWAAPANAVSPYVQDYQPAVAPPAQQQWAQPPQNWAPTNQQAPYAQGYQPAVTPPQQQWAQIPRDWAPTYQPSPYTHGYHPAVAPPENPWWPQQAQSLAPAPLGQNQALPVQNLGQAPPFYNPPLCIQNLGQAPPGGQAQPSPPHSLSLSNAPGLQPPATDNPSNNVQPPAVPTVPPQQDQAAAQPESLQIGECNRSRGWLSRSQAEQHRKINNAGLEPPQEGERNLSRTWLSRSQAIQQRKSHNAGLEPPPPLTKTRKRSSSATSTEPKPEPSEEVNAPKRAKRNPTFQRMIDEMAPKSSPEPKTEPKSEPSEEVNAPKRAKH